MMHACELKISLLNARDSVVSFLNGKGCEISICLMVTKAIS